MKPSILFCFIGLGAALHLVPSAPTKKFELNLTWDTKAPDGVERQQSLINGQFPGPPLLFDEGDNVEVTVNNFLPYNTTMHWHGIEDIVVRWCAWSLAETYYPWRKICLQIYYFTIRNILALTLNNGARYSVLVQLNKTPGNYSITAAGAGINQKIAGYGTFSYVDGDPSVVGKPSIDYGGNSISTDVVVLKENKIKPLIPSRPSEQADRTYLLTVGRIEKAWKWSLNGDNSYSMSLESEKPMLWDPQSQADSDLVIATNNDTWVDIVFTVSGEASTIQPGHPIHKHSNRVYVLGIGTGKFNWTSVAEAQREIPDKLNLVDPPMRDTFTTLPSLEAPNWMAVRYHVQNPGAFFLHCHIDPHLTGGMALAILDGIDTWPSIPTQYGPNGHWGKAAK
ncbi:hypothetical protein N7537_002951 [Penicillium hordei]|uniref:Multicopper oxidase n=1 Tax=Penicillium hordei TaxID=40994 RepID=A0AAD6H923_9EURO|nr:uncharacterized protein N7537_002951 [Penicillium hordei]KAJ5617837.1 hypothetical protein N7537_002951 [Penicillium hordei]